MENERVTVNEVKEKIRSIQTGIGILRFIRVFSILGVIGIPFAIVGTAMSFMAGGRLYLLLLPLCIIVFIFAVVNMKLLKKQEQKLKNLVGTHMVKDILAERIQVEEYVPNLSPKTTVLKECRILPSYNEICGTDYVKGTYRDVRLQYCDLTLRDDDGETCSKVFCGYWLNLGLKEALDGYIMIKKRKIPRKEKGVLSGVLNGAADTFGIKKKDVFVEIENEVFHKNFDVKTDNSEMAYAVLTPAYIEQLLRVDEICGGYTNFEFKGKNLFVTANNGYDAFELDKEISGQKLFEKSMERFRSDVERIVAIADLMMANDAFVLIKDEETQENINAKENTSKKQIGNDLFGTFVAEMQAYPETGKLPGSCDRDMQYCMQLQKERHAERGFAVKDEFVPRGNFADINSEVFQYEDDKYQYKIFARSCRYKKRVYKENSKLFSYSENRNLYQTVVYNKNNQKVENEDYVCPNCGAVCKVKELMNGCAYCSTRFKMDELFPKVTNFFSLMDLGKTKSEVGRSLLMSILICILILAPIFTAQDYIANGSFVLTNFIWILVSSLPVGCIAGFIVWAIWQVMAIFIAGHKSFAINFSASGSAAKFERQMKKYTPEFSYAYFTGKVISVLRMMMYAKDVQELPMYMGESVNNLFEDILDAHYRGALVLRKLEMVEDYCYVTVDSYMEVLRAGSSVRRKNEIYRIVLCKNMTTPLDVNFSISKIHCKNCNASFDATRQCNCPSCGSKYAVMDEDWVVMSVKRKVVVL